MLPYAALKRITTWIFDLDNTLYPPEAGLYPQLTARVTQWLKLHLGLNDEQVLALQKRYLAQHGATLGGLVRDYKVDAEEFLDYVHRIDYSNVLPNPALAAAIAALPGRRVIHTNGSCAHAKRVLERLGIPEDAFEGIFDLHDTGYIAKPEMPAFLSLVMRYNLHPGECCFVEDSLRNLETARALGMQGLLVRYGEEAQEPVPHGCDDATDDLAAWLAEAGRQLKRMY